MKTIATIWECQKLIAEAERRLALNRNLHKKQPPKSSMRRLYAQFIRRDEFKISAMREHLSRTQGVRKP